MNFTGEIIQSPLFTKQKKKLHKNLIKGLDRAVKFVAENPEAGEMKTGDLQGVRVYKFKLNNRPVLLAYELSGSALYLYTFGFHENFYKDQKKYLQH